MSDCEKLGVQTSDNFYPLRSVELDRNSVESYGQIQQMISQLTQKKALLRQLKIQAESLRAKYDQQDKRLGQIRISIGHNVEMEEIENQNESRFRDLATLLREDIKKLHNDIETLKDDLSVYFQDIMAKKKKREELTKQRFYVEERINEIENKKQELQENCNEKQEEGIQLQNRIRSENEIITKLSLQIADLESLQLSYNKKITIGKKQLHSETCKNRDLSLAIQNLNDKIKNLNQQEKENIWGSEKIEATNRQVREVNEKLSNDLQSVNLHLASVKNTNQILNQNIQQYCLTAHKVAKIVLLESPKYN